MVVTIPGMKPCSLRVDQLDREFDEAKEKPERNLYDEFRDEMSESASRTNETATLPDFSGTSKENSLKNQPDNFMRYPEIVHFGIRPPQLSYAKKPE